MNPTCTACGRAPVGRYVAKYGWCGACHMRWRRAGKPDAGPPSPDARFTARLDALDVLEASGYDGNIRLAARFWSKVDRRGPLECWPWTGAPNEHGYGVMRPEGKRSGPTVKAHRVSVLLDGRDPEGWCVLHSCDNPPYVNPAHLSLGTYADNARDMANKGRAGITSKLMVDQVLEIRAAVASGERHTDVAARFGVSRTNIHHIVNGATWTRVSAPTAALVEAITGEALERSL